MLVPDGSSNVVRVLSRDRNKVYLTRLTRFAYRPKVGDLDWAIALGESAAGNPPTVKAWYPQSETRGREFIY